MTDNFSKLLGKMKNAVSSLREEIARNHKERSRLNELERKLVKKNTLASGHEKRPKETMKIDISAVSAARATLAILGVIALGWFLLEIKNILVLFGIAAFVAFAFDPFVDELQKWKIPRAIGILLIYSIFTGILGIVIYSFVPILANELPKLAKAVLSWVSGFGIDTTFIQNELSSFQNYLTNLQESINRENIEAGFSALGSIGQNAFSIVKTVAGGAANFVFVFVIAFFMTIEEDGIKKFMISLFPKRFHKYIFKKGIAVEEKFSAWVRGQITLMLVIGVLTFIALKIAGVNYAATLATFAGLMELIPYVGPFLALVPAAILALSQNGIVFAGVVVTIFIVIQQLENNVVVPLVMKKAVGLSPVVTMFAMLVGASFPETINPIVGIIVSLPIATIISVFVRDLTEAE